LSILIAIFSALGIAAFWFYRMRNVGHAASEVVDTARRIRGVYRRKRFRNKAESSPIESVGDPAAAAVAMLIALASSRGLLSPAAETAIKGEMRNVMALTNIDEVFTFARWVAEHANDPGNLTLRFSKLWMSALQPSERADLHAMASRIAAVDGEPTDLQAGCLKALHVRLGLTRA
jgi:hypothetical protein